MHLLPGTRGILTAVPLQCPHSGRAYIDLLFRTEDRIRDLPYEEKKQKRQEAVRPVLDAFWSES